MTGCARNFRTPAKSSHAIPVLRAAAVRRSSKLRRPGADGLPSGGVHIAATVSSSWTSHPPETAPVYAEFRCGSPDGGHGHPRYIARSRAKLEWVSPPRQPDRVCSGFLDNDMTTVPEFEGETACSAAVQPVCRWCHWPLSQPVRPREGAVADLLAGLDIGRPRGHDAHPVNCTSIDGRNRSPGQLRRKQ